MRQKASSGLRSCPASRGSLHQRTARVRPPEWLGEYPIEIRHEVPQLRAQVRYRGERATPDHLPHDHTEDHLDLVQPRTVLRKVHEPNPMTRLRQERLPA